MLSIEASILFINKNLVIPKRYLFSSLHFLFMPADPSQVSKDLDELRHGWYSIAKLCEGLKRYGSAKEEGFVGSLDAVLSGIESFEKLLDEVYQSIISSFPARPEKIESRKNEILEELVDLKEKVKRDQEKIASLGETDEEVIKTKLEKLQHQYGDLERETSESCNKYFDRKKEYTIALERIEREVSKRVEAIRDAFVEKTSEIAEGHEISLHGRSTSMEELFNTLVGGHEDMDIEGINIKPVGRGGFLDVITGTVSKHERAKESVLKYEVQEIVQKALPLKKREAELIAKLDRKFSDLKGLEDDCKKAEEKREDVVNIRDRLRTELEEVEPPEKLKDTYLRNLDEAMPKVESFISLTKVIGESKAGLDQGREEFLANVETKKQEMASLKTEMGEGAEEPSKEELLEYKKRVEELKLLIEQLEAEIERRIDAIE